MIKKLSTQIKNEWRTNSWLFVELLLVSVVMWFVVDALFVKYSILNQPRGFAYDNCYLLTMGRLTEENPDFVPYADEDGENAAVIELLNRLQHHPDIEAASLSHNAYPFNGNNSNLPLRYDSIDTDPILRYATPDFVRVFRYEGANGETADELADVIRKGDILVSENILDYADAPYGIAAGSLVGKELVSPHDSTNRRRVSAVIRPVRYHDFTEIYAAASILQNFGWMNADSELCIRVKAGQENGFVDRLKADIDKSYRVGNIYIADVRSFDDIHRHYHLGMMQELQTDVVGIGFLLLNIFLGLLGTFWFRTQQRKGEIALHKVMGSTNRAAFVRLMSEGLLLLLFATIPAMVIDLNIAFMELNETMNGTTFEPMRFATTVAITFGLMAAMIGIGIWFPAYKAMRIQPAEALHDE